MNKMEIGDLVWATIMRITREDKRVYSMPTQAEIQGRCRNLLGLLVSRAKLFSKYEKLKDPDSKEIWVDKIKKFDEVLNKALEEERDRRAIYKEFLQIG